MDAVRFLDFDSVVPDPVLDKAGRRCVDSEPLVHLEADACSKKAPGCFPSALQRQPASASIPQKWMCVTVQLCAFFARVPISVCRRAQGT